jgi:streptogramin lyase
MAKKSDERYGSAGEFARELERAAIGPSPATEPTVMTPVAVPFEPTDEATDETAPAEPSTVAAAEPTPPPPSQNRRRLLGALAGLAVVGGVAAVITIAGGDDEGGAGGNGAGAAAAGPAGKPKLVDEIPAGDQPVGVTLDGGRLLVGSRADGKVFAFGLDGEKLEEFQIPGSGIDFVVPGFGSLWAAGGDTNLLYELDPETLQPTDELPTGAFPRDILVTDDLIWVANRDENSLQKIDPEAGTSISETVPGEYPRRLVGDGGLMWVSYRDGAAVQALDVVTGKAPDPPVDVGGEPHGMFVADGYLWIANTLRDSVQKIDLADPTGDIVEFEDACDEPRDVEVAFDSVWVTCGLEQALVELDPELTEERGRVRFDSGLETLTTSENPDRVWVAGGTAGLLYGVDPGG